MLYFHEALILVNAHLCATGSGSQFMVRGRCQPRRVEAPGSLPMGSQGSSRSSCVLWFFDLDSLPYHLQMSAALPGRHPDKESQSKRFLSPLSESLPHITVLPSIQDGGIIIHRFISTNGFFPIKLLNNTLNHDLCYQEGLSLLDNLVHYSVFPRPSSLRPAVWDHPRHDYVFIPVHEV